MMEDKTGDDLWSNVRCDLAIGWARAIDRKFLLAEAARCGRYACHACGAVYVRTHRPSVCQRCHSPVILAAPVGTFDTRSLVGPILYSDGAFDSMFDDIVGDVCRDLGLDL